MAVLLPQCSLFFRDGNQIVDCSQPALWIMIWPHLANVVCDTHSSPGIWKEEYAHMKAKDLATDYWQVSSVTRALMQYWIILPKGIN